jgi:hypothetical protein
MSQGPAGFLRDLLEAASQHWEEKIEGFDQQQQLGILRSIERLFESQSDTASRSSNAKFNWRRWGLGLSGAALMIVGFVIWRRRNQSAPAERLDHSAAVARSIGLYRRLERVLEARGIARPVSTPALTHARGLCEAGHPLGPETLALTEIYMKARFGDHEISDQQAKEFVARLSELRRIPLPASEKKKAAA